MIGVHVTLCNDHLVYSDSLNVHVLNVRVLLLLYSTWQCIVSHDRQLYYIICLEFTVYVILDKLLSLFLSSSLDLSISAFVTVCMCVCVCVCVYDFIPSY